MFGNNLFTKKTEEELKREAAKKTLPRCPLCGDHMTEVSWTPYDSMYVVYHPKCGYAFGAVPLHMIMQKPQ